jgi:ATP-binding cassette subfamily B (MDR/TAP) protein 1
VTTKRIREAYLRSVLRQNIGFFDTLGAGEVTTRITSDMHLIQEGISEKIPITAQFFGESRFFVHKRRGSVKADFVPTL